MMRFGFRRKQLRKQNTQLERMGHLFKHSLLFKSTIKMAVFEILKKKWKIHDSDPYFWTIISCWNYYWCKTTPKGFKFFTKVTQLPLLLQQSRFKMAEILTSKQFNLREMTIYLLFSHLKELLRLYIILFYCFFISCLLPQILWLKKKQKCKKQRSDISQYRPNKRGQ
jgi:hypothetical protein